MSNDTISIPLSKQGKHKGKYETIVDAIDSDLAQLNWCVKIYENTSYAVRIPKQGDKKTIIRLHRIILQRMIGRDLLWDEYPDHIDGNGFNNRRENLRVATKAQNQANRNMQSNNKSGYKGVYQHKYSKKWIAQVKLEGRNIYLGSFETKELANQAAIQGREKYHGDFANHESK